MRTAPRTYRLRFTCIEHWCETVQAFRKADAEKIGQERYPDCSIEIDVVHSCPHCGSTKIRYTTAYGGDLPEIFEIKCQECERILAKEDLY